MNPDHLTITALHKTRAHTNALPLGKLARWLTFGLEYLALAALMTTLLSLGYWRPYVVATLPLSWVSNEQYRLLILYPSDFGASATVVFWLLARIMAATTGQARTSLRFGPRSLTLSLLGLAVLSAFSATQAVVPILALEVALHLLVLLALVIAIINMRPPFWAIVGPLALLSAGEGVLSLLQVRAQSTLFGHFLFNWDQDTTALQLGSSVVQTSAGLRWLRAYGTFPHPNILGGFLCLSLPMLVGAYLHLPVGWRLKPHLKAPSRQAHLIGGLILLVALALALLALLLSFSRTAWIGLFAGICWCGLLLWLKRRAARQKSEAGVERAVHMISQGRDRSSFQTRWWLRRRFRPVLLAIVGIGLLIGLVTALSPVIQARFLVSSPLERRSISERLGLLQLSAVLWSQHPWLGVGAGNMVVVELSLPVAEDFQVPTHNTPILIGVESGTFGTLLWFIAPIGVLLNVWRRRLTLSSKELATSTTLIALLVAAQLDYYLWTFDTGRLIYWLALVFTSLWCDLC